MTRYRVELIEGRAVVARFVDLVDPQEAATRLGIQGGRIVSVRAVTDVPAVAQMLGRKRFPLRLFSQELSVLLGAGLPLLEAIVTLREKETSAPICDALDAIIDRVGQGQRFSLALTDRPDAFDGLFVAIVASAERTGQLEQALRAHAAYLAWVEDLKGKLVQACIYPAMLVVASFSVLLFLLVFVVPRFASLLDGLNGDIPAASRLLIDLGAVTGAHPWVTISIGVAMLTLPIVVWRQPRERVALERLLWRVPFLGGKLRLLALARLYRTVGMLLRAGVPVVSALEIASGVLAAPLRPSLERVRKSVGQGERFSTALDRERLSTPVSVRMVRVGERSGEMGAMLTQAAAFYDEELTRLSEIVTRLVNPLLMLVMGGVIGTVIVLMYLPIFQLVEQVQ